VRAAVTAARGVMEVRDVPHPSEPRAGEVLVSPEAVGLCGSDFHFFLGDLDDPDVEPYPRIQGHEAAGIVEAVGPDCPDLRIGGRVALWPVVSCGRCYLCHGGRPNVCVDLSLIGIHRDGALQDRLRVPATQVFPVDDLDPALAALVEPVSIAVHAVARGRVASGERVLVLGAGPIGQALAVAATDRGAGVLLLDRVESRVALGKTTGAEAVVLADGDDPAVAVRAWAGDDGPEVVFEATGAPGMTRSAIELVVQGGRVVVVGLSSHEEPIRVGELVFRELDVLGVSCCTADEFAEAVALVTRRRDALAGLITHEFPLEETPEAIRYAMRHPAEVMKAVIRLERT
jgi:threonine dehydrogenase-like Zn-dependent dehydrogenase